MKVDLYYGSYSSKIFGINRCKIEILKNLPKDIDKKIISYKPRNRVLNYLDFLTYAPLSTIKYRRKNSISHILSQSEAHLLHFFKFKKSIVLCYDIIPYVLPYGSRFSKIKSKISYSGMKKADHIITISQFTKDEIVKHLKIHPSKISVAYIGVNKNYKPLKNLNKIREKYKLNKDNQYLVYIGNEEPRMNLDTILRAFKKVKETNPNLKLIKVGTSNFLGMRKRLLKLIKKLNLQNEVIFTNYVPEEDLPYLYNISSISIYIPSYAGFGLPIVESMACGTPTIGSNLSSLPEVIGKGGLTVNPRDYEELANTISMILNNPNLAKDLSIKGREQSKKFTWKNFAKTTVEVYNKI